MLRALGEFEVGGVSTLIPLHQAILERPEFIAGGSLHAFVEGGGYAATLPEESRNGAVDTAELQVPRTLLTEVDGKRFEVTVSLPEPAGRRRLRLRRESLALRAATSRGGVDVVTSPMQGTVLKVGVAAGDRVEAGTVLVVVEAMKMENEIVASHGGEVEGVEVAVGDQVASGQPLVRLA
jgi:acetyl-CoA/propionyl-CoA carboxylase biotin carboxyl carrier protein